MDVISKARELGAAIQQDERYLAFKAAKETNDGDMKLNELIGKINLIQMSYQNESEKEAPDEAKLEKMDAEFRTVYGEIMLNESMRNYEEKKQEVDSMMKYVIDLLTLCVNGEDPLTCEPSESADCTGNCASCGGCG